MNIKLFLSILYQVFIKFNDIEAIEYDEVNQFLKQVPRHGEYGTQKKSGQRFPQQSY